MAELYGLGNVIISEVANRLMTNSDIMTFPKPYNSAIN